LPPQASPGVGRRPRPPGPRFRGASRRGWGRRSYVSPIGKEATLQHHQEAIDAEGQHGYDNENEEDVFGRTAPLANIDEVSKSVFGVHQLSQHDVPEGKAKQTSQGRVDIG